MDRNVKAFLKRRTDYPMPFGQWKALRLFFCLLVASIHLARGSETPTLIDRPNAGSGATQISVAIWFVDVSSIDSAQQSFTADVVVVLRWKDTRLAHSGGGVALYPLDQIWNPRVVVVNETNSISHRFPDSVEVGTDGTVIYRQRLVSSFTQALVLKSFPFDKQVFRVQLAAVKYSPSEVSLVPDEKWIAAGSTGQLESRRQ
jgi:hypothetical protein